MVSHVQEDHRDVGQVLDVERVTLADVNATGETGGLDIRLRFPGALRIDVDADAAACASADRGSRDPRVAAPRLVDHVTLPDTGQPHHRLRDVEGSRDVDDANAVRRI